MCLPFKKGFGGEEGLLLEQWERNPQNRLTQCKHQQATCLALVLHCQLFQRSSCKAAGVAKAAGLHFTGSVRRRGWLGDPSQTRSHSSAWMCSKSSFRCIKGAYEKMESDP